MSKKEMIKNMSEDTIAAAAKDQIGLLLATLIPRGLGGMAGAGAGAFVIKLEVATSLDEDAGEFIVSASGDVEVKMGGKERSKPIHLDAVGQGHFKGM